MLKCVLCLVSWAEHEDNQHLVWKYFNLFLALYFCFLWFRLKYLNNWMDRHEIWQRHSWSSVGEAYWLWWTPDFRMAVGFKYCWWCIWIIHSEVWFTGMICTHRHSDVCSSPLSHLCLPIDVNGLHWLQHDFLDQLIVKETGDLARSH